MASAARGQALTNAKARQVLDADAATARKALRRLVARGLLVQHGESGGTRYVANEEKVTLLVGHRVDAYVPPEEQAARIMELARQQPITNALLRERLGLSRAEALKHLSELVAQGRLAQHGERRGTHYLPA